MAASQCSITSVRMQPTVRSQPSDYNSTKVKKIAVSAPTTSEETVMVMIDSLIHAKYDKTAHQRQYQSTLDTNPRSQ